MKVKASAPAKVILFGEHAVVYGQPAIAVAIDKRATVTLTSKNNNTEKKEIVLKALDLKLEATINLHSGKNVILANHHDKIVEATAKIIEVMKERHDADWPESMEITIVSQIPRGAGLGSSAAISVASTAALATAAGIQLSKDEISSIAFEAERIHHGTPSGIDNTISTFGGAVYFKRPEVKNFSIPSFSLIIGDTKKERETKKVVLGVKERKERLPHIYNPLLDVFGNLVDEALQVLTTEPLELETLGHLFNVNQGLLNAIGVSSLELEQLIWASRNAGALGAKLTGAGAGGSMIALIETKKEQNVSEAIKNAGGEPLTVSIDTKGVITEEME